MTEDTKPYGVITAEELHAKMEQAAPDNESKGEGYALIDVLSAESYGAKHLPQSINIPRGGEDETEKRFDKKKEIIVYCASPTCSASPAVASALVERGFKNVVDYEAGLSGWLEAGHTLEGDATE